MCATHGWEAGPVTERMHPVLINGQYQVVALTAGQEYEPEDIVAYAVTTISGARLHYALTLDDAKSWMDRLLEEEALPHPVRSLEPGRKRIRR